ncbi:MAG: Ig-like domain-containing protein [Verrucomicrobia bacterium]|nr:Ig-like domain-containing protein [Verrucomicrobiota bacterium]
MPANPSTAGQPWSVTGLEWQLKTLSFTVPEDGAYHLTFFSPANGVWEKIWIDEVRLIGNFNSAPSVTLSPGSNFKSFAGGFARLTAVATDADGSIDRVEFLVDGEPISAEAVITAPPYVFDWENLPEGNQVVIARAYDNEGGYGDSTPLEILVEPNHFSIATLLGGPDADESFTAAAYLSDGTLVLGAVMDPYLLTEHPVYLNGASTGDRGVVALMTEDGTAVISVTVVGTGVWDLSIDGSDRFLWLQPLEHWRSTPVRRLCSGQKPTPTVSRIVSTQPPVGFLPCSPPSLPITLPIHCHRPPDTFTLPTSVTLPTWREPGNTPWTWRLMR